MARYRLRFVLQEFDLPQGITVIGRSLECHLTIEDPLVSRRHARIIVGADGAYIEDAGSRNGIKVNGAVVKEPTLLSNGDRVRIGTQDFVFCCVDPAGRANARTTGQLRLCANCHMPYPRELLACPNCEATEQTDEDTLTGSGAHQGPHSWTVQLLLEALERALRLGRVSDAERLARRATAQVEELVGAGRPVDTRALAGLAVQTTATSLVSNDPTWALWVIDVYARLELVPPLEVADALADVAVHHRVVIGEALAELLDVLIAAERTETGEPETGEALRRLHELYRSLYDSVRKSGVAEGQHVAEASVGEGHDAREGTGPRTPVSRGTRGDDAPGAS